MTTLIFYIFLFFVSVFLLIFAGQKSVESLSKLSRFLNVKEFVLAFILMAFATSIPELFVGISAALNNVSELSLGDIFGANIVDLTLAIGLVVLILGKLEIERETVKRNSIFMAIIGLLPLLLLLDGDISRIDGVVLFLAFAFYMSWLFNRKELFRKVYNDIEPTLFNFKNFLKDLAIFGVSVTVLLFSSYEIIQSAIFFAEFFKIGLGIIGIVLVGAGTALPEVYFSIQAGRSSQSPMILGNLMGSIVVNSTFILGLVALIQPIKIVDFSSYEIARIFLLIAVLFFLLISRTQNKISRKEALALISIYSAFLVFEIIFK